MLKETKLEELKEKHGKNTILVGVYGSLRKGFHNHSLLSGCKLLGTVKTEPIFNLYSLGGFPGLLPGGTTAVTLEVYLVKNISTQQSLDRLEGYRSEEYNDPGNPHANFYNKMTIDTEFGETVIYIYNNTSISEDRLIPSGDWANRELVKKEKEIPIEITEDVSSE